MTIFTEVIDDPPMLCPKKNPHDEHVWYRTSLEPNRLISQTCEGISGISEELSTTIMHIVSEWIVTEAEDLTDNSIAYIAKGATKDIAKAIGEEYNSV